MSSQSGGASKYVTQFNIEFPLAQLEFPF